MKTRFLAVLMPVALAACSTPQPSEYAASLSPQDPKWRSAECVKIRAAARDYEAGEKQTLSFSAGMLGGPYGLGIALAGKEHQAKKRKQLARDMHQNCSSLPLPKSLK